MSKPGLMRWVWWVTLATALGCQAGPSVVAPGSLTRALSRVPYPKDTPAADMDIVVVRAGQAIVLTNRTTSSYRQVHLWINQQWVTRVEFLPIGTAKRIELSQFIDKHSEPFPVGGFFTPDKTLPVLLVEMYVSPSPDSPPEAESVSAPDPAGVGIRTGQRYRLLVREEVG